MHSIKIRLCTEHIDIQIQIVTRGLTLHKCILHANIYVVDVITDLHLASIEDKMS